MQPVKKLQKRKESAARRPEPDLGGNYDGIWLPPMEVTELIRGTGLDRNGLIYSPSVGGALSPVPEGDDEDAKLFELGR